MKINRVKIGYIIYEGQGSYGMIDGENIHLLDFLIEKGLDIHKEIWSDKNVNWKSYDILVLKAPWDYFERINEFMIWLDQIKKLNIPLLNPLDIVKWNYDKHYLKEISDAGLSVTSMIFLEKGQAPDLMSCFEKWNTEKIVIKPCISGGSRHTYAINRNQIEEFTPLLTELLKTEAFLVQPFITEIGEGEWSFMFFNNTFSHALIKKPKEDDFRVQNHFGGTIHSVTPSESLIIMAQRYVDAFAQGCLYARVDGVFVNNEFELMELELIEPALYLFTHANSFQNYLKALTELVEGRIIDSKSVI